ncbi:retrovirus-related pol polyprotein from transposon TNT 1-94 [Tanacetum coccineum]
MLQYLLLPRWDETEPQQPEEPEPTLEDEFQDLHLNLPVLEVLAHAPIYNAILDKYVESLELGKNGSTFVQGEIPAKIEDPRLFTLPCRLGDSKLFDTLADLGSCVNIIPLYFFKKLNIGLLEETDHIFGLADETISYLVGIVKDVEVHIGKLKLLNEFYDCRMAKIAVGEGITRTNQPKTGDGAWARHIILIDPDEEEFTKTLQSIPTTRKLSERESPREIIDLDHFYDTLYLMRTSLEVLRKFHWMILGG